MVLQGGRLSGGTLNRTDGSDLVFTTSGGTLDGMTVNGDLDLSQVSGVGVTITNNLVLNGTMYVGNTNGSTHGVVYFGTFQSSSEALSGAATVVFGGNGANTIYNYSGTGGTLTLAPTVTVRGRSGALRSYWGNGIIVNQGTIAADDSSRQASFPADSNFSESYTGSTAATIDTTGVSNAAPSEVYQTHRGFHDFNYNLPNLTVGAEYTVRLHFAEIDFNAAGERKFNVDINGARVLTDFDIFAAAGGKNKAVVQEFTAIADSSVRLPSDSTINHRID